LLTFFKFKFNMPPFARLSKLKGVFGKREPEKTHNNEAAGSQADVKQR
jgi:hypothetical protein